jgi:glycosyltransferase involved in cell wall biosynthesis
MKIAYVRDTLYPYTKGGAQKRLWEISKRQVNRGHEVHIFGMKYWEGKDTILNNGIYLHGVCKPQKMFVKNRRSISGPIIFASKVLFPLLKEDYDIIVCDNFPYFHCFPAKICSVIKGKPLVINWIEVWDDYWYEYLGNKGIFGKTIEKLTAHLSKNVISISDSTKKGFENINHRVKMEVIPCGIDFQEIQLISPHNENSDLIYAGRLTKQKNIDLLIKSVALVKEEIPSIKCIIIGHGPEYEELKRLTVDLKLQNNIFFLGFLDSYNEVLSYMKSSKIFVLPSTREGFGIVGLEANACGLPFITISHERNAAADLIIANYNGFLCTFSEEDLCEKILTLLEDKRLDMKESCIKNSQEYDWNKITDSLEIFYDKLV